MASRRRWGPTSRWRIQWIHHCYIFVTYFLLFFVGLFFWGDFDWRTQFYLIHHPSPSLSLWLKFFESSRLNALGEFLDQEVQQRRERHQALVEAHLTPGFVLTLQVWENMDSLFLRHPNKECLLYGNFMEIIGVVRVVHIQQWRTHSPVSLFLCKLELYTAVCPVECCRTWTFPVDNRGTVPFVKKHRIFIWKGLKTRIRNNTDRFDDFKCLLRCIPTKMGWCHSYWHQLLRLWQLVLDP